MIRLLVKDIKGKIQYKDLKSFSDLEFEPHSIGIISADHQQAVEVFSNGYDISVLKGERFYSNGVSTYETWVSFDRNVKGYLSEKQVTKEMIRAQLKVRVWHI